MSNKHHWEYDPQTGTPNAIVVSIPGHTDLKVDVAGIDCSEATRIDRAIAGASGPALDRLVDTVSDGIAFYEKPVILTAFNAELRKIGIVGTVSDVEMVADSGSRDALGEAVAGIAGDIAAIGAPILRRAFPAAAGFANPSAYFDYNAASQTLDVETGRHDIHIRFKGLSEQEASILEQKIADNPRIAESIYTSLRAIAQDGKITAAERAHINNMGEQWLIRGGVTADVAGISLSR